MALALQVSFLSLYDDGSFCRWEVAEAGYLSVSTSLMSKLKKPSEFWAWVGTELKLLSCEPAWSYQDHLVAVAMFWTQKHMELKTHVENMPSKVSAEGFI